VEVEETADVDGPLPVLGVHFLWDIGANLWFEGLAQVFALEIDEYDGGLADYKIGITWFPWRHVGIGVGYNSFIARLDVREDDFHGRLRLGYRGPLAYLSVGF
jgi:hypothetical protein